MNRDRAIYIKHLAFVTFLVLILGRTLLAQENAEVHQQTTPPSNARYEIL
jgi:hypothetical protein